MTVHVHVCISGKKEEKKKGKKQKNKKKKKKKSSVCLLSKERRCHELYGICITIIICQYWKSRDVR